MKSGRIIQPREFKRTLEIKNQQEKKKENFVSVKVEKTKNEQKIKNNKSENVKKFKMEFILVPEVQKEIYFCYILNERAGNRIVSIMDDDRDVVLMTGMLRAIGFCAVPLTENMASAVSTSILEKFVKGDYPILICKESSFKTKFSNQQNSLIDILIHYDIPTNPKDYATRMGLIHFEEDKNQKEQDKEIITIVTQYDIEYLQKIERMIGYKMEEFPFIKDDVMSLVNSVTKALKKARAKLKEIDPRTFKSNKRQKDDLEEAMKSLKKENSIKK